MLMIPPHTLLVAQQQKFWKIYLVLPKNCFLGLHDDKCHLILSSPEENTAIQIEESIIKCLKIKKLLGIHTDYKFDTHVDNTNYKHVVRSEKTQCTFESNKLYEAS